jgi:hypothetical protein
VHPNIHVFSWSFEAGSPGATGIGETIIRFNLKRVPGGEAWLGSVRPFPLRGFHRLFP